MNQKTIIFSAIIIFMFCVAAGAAEYKFTYKKGKIESSQNEIKSGKDSIFAISYGAACELRCGPESQLEINSVTKTGESVFILKAGSCFVRIIDDGSGASVTLRTPFVVLKSTDAAFYVGYWEKAASVYSGSARIEFDKRMAKLTQGRTFSSGKIFENKLEENAFKDWAVKRDKTDIFISLQVDSKEQENIVKMMSQTMVKVYTAGHVVFSHAAGPEDIAASITISAKQGGLTASGVLSSEITGALGIIDLVKDTDMQGDPFKSQALMPLVYEAAAAILKNVDLTEAGFMKNGRKVIVEAEGLSNADYTAIENQVRIMPGFISVNQKKYHNTKVVFEILQAGTGYDIAEVLSAKFEKTNISIWKYSKNIVKLRVVKVER